MGTSEQYWQTYLKYAKEVGTHPVLVLSFALHFLGFLADLDFESKTMTTSTSSDFDSDDLDLDFDFSGLIFGFFDTLATVGLRVGCPDRFWMEVAGEGVGESVSIIMGVFIGRDVGCIVGDHCEGVCEGASCITTGAFVGRDVGCIVGDFLDVNIRFE